MGLRCPKNARLLKYGAIEKQYTAARRVEYMESTG